MPRWCIRSLRPASRVLTRPVRQSDTLRATLTRGSGLRIAASATPLVSYKARCETVMGAPLGRPGCGPRVRERQEHRREPFQDVEEGPEWFGEEPDDCAGGSTSAACEGGPDGGGEEGESGEGAHEDADLGDVAFWSVADDVDSLDRATAEFASPDDFDVAASRPVADGEPAEGGEENAVEVTRYLPAPKRRREQR
jgi:hypothetical protein